MAKRWTNDSSRAAGQAQNQPEHNQISMFEPVEPKDEAIKMPATKTCKDEPSKSSEHSVSVQIKVAYYLVLSENRFFVESWDAVNLLISMILG